MSAAATTPGTSSVPWPGKQRWCRLHSSSPMSSSGASATCRKPIRSPGMPASAAPSSPRASMWKVSTASVTAGWSARTTAAQAWPTRLTCRPHASASNATEPPYSAASAPTAWSCSAVRSMSGEESAAALEQARILVAPSSAITSSLVRTRCSTCGEPLRWDALHVAHGLEQVDGQTEVGAPPGHLGRRQRARDEVVVEDLYAVEAGAGDRVQLVGEQAAQRDGGDPGRDPAGVRPGLEDRRGGGGHFVSSPKCASCGRRRARSP